MTRHDDDNRRPLRGGFRWLIAGCAGAALTTGAFADPPPDNPCKDVEMDPLFCIRVTDIESAEDDHGPNTWRVMFLFVNWTVGDVHAVRLSINEGTGDARFVDDKQMGFFPQPITLAKDGRPFCTYIPDPDTMMTCPPMPPLGNMFIQNCFVPELTTTSPTSVTFRGGGVQVIPPATGMGTQGGVPMTYTGFFDCDLRNSDSCGEAIADMIPGATYDPFLEKIVIPDIETIDDGENVLDGFVITLKNWLPGEIVSLNWSLLDANGDVIKLGSCEAFFPDPMAFGIFNLARFDDGPPPPPPLVARDSGDDVIYAPDPPFVENIGFNPESTKHENDPRYWAEDIVNDVAQFPINPIPANKPGAGTWFGVEFGAEAWGGCVNPSDCDPTIPPTLTPNNGGNPNPCVMADVNQDGGVDSRDLLLVLENMPPNPWLIPEADVNRDGVVDMQDVQFVLDHMGPFTPCRPNTPSRPGVGVTPQKPVIGVFEE